MKKGAISISTLLWAVGGIAAAMMWVMNYVNTALAPIQAQAQETASQVYNFNAQMQEANTKLDFILGKYNGYWSDQTQSVKPIK